MHQHRPDESGREQTRIAAPQQSKGGGGTAGREAGAESRLLREASVIPVLDCQTFDPHRPESQRVVRRHTAPTSPQPQIPHAGAAVLPSEQRCPSPLPFSASLDPRSPKHGTLSFNRSLDPRSPHTPRRHRTEVLCPCCQSRHYMAVVVVRRHQSSSSVVIRPWKSMKKMSAEAAMGWCTTSQGLDHGKILRRV